MKKVLILASYSPLGVHLSNLLKQKSYEFSLYSTDDALATYVPGVEVHTGPAKKEALLQQKWDVVIDLITQYPANMQENLDKLKQASLYIYCSSCSVYKSESPNLLLRREDAETRECSAEEAVSENIATFGARKAACERLLMASAIPYLLLRPFMIYGAHDQTDLLYYWLYRIREGGLLMIPDQGERLFSATYMKDMSQTILQALKKQPPHEVYNVISSPMLSIRKIIDRASPILNQHCMMLNAPPAFLHTNQVCQWTDMPLWVDGDHYTYNANRWQKDFNIKPTDFREGLLETLTYYADRGWPPPRCGMTVQDRNHLLKQLRQTML